MIPAVYAFCKWASWAYLRVTRGYRVVGAENIPATGPLIIACNHVSYFDPPALGAAVPRPVAYMAKSELFEIPVLGALIRALGAFPVDRSRGDVAAIKAAVRVLQAGAVFGIFPEGGRNVDGTKTPQMGVALLASMSGATVVPAYVSGTSQAKRAGPVTVVFGEPLRFEAGQKARREALAKWTDELMSRIYGLRETIGAH
jgi:1-acyl-sn-glycerol-3-phosphate acyltransferase